MAIRLCEFNIADYEAVYAIWQNAGHGIGIGRSDTREEIAKKLQHDPDLFLGAQEDKIPWTPPRIIGTVIGGYDGRRGLIYHLAVEDPYRGRGIAKILMDEIERRLIEKGCLKAYLLVLRGERETVEFYEHRGWKAMPVTPMGKSF